LRLEFDRRLAEEKRILSAKYDSEVDELRVSLESKVEDRNAQINELENLRKLESERHGKEVDVWRARDRKVHSSLLGLEDALRGMLSSRFSALAPLRRFLILRLPLQRLSLIPTRPPWRRYGSTGWNGRSSLAMTPRPSFPRENWLRLSRAGFIQLLNWAGNSAKPLFLSLKPCG
jgi:hypothetical protein